MTAQNFLVFTLCISALTILGGLLLIEWATHVSSKQVVVIPHAVVTDIRRTRPSSKRGSLTKGAVCVAGRPQRVIWFTFPLHIKEPNVNKGDHLFQVTITRADSLFQKGRWVIEHWTESIPLES